MEKVTEEERLKMCLLQERAQRFQAEKNNLTMVLKQLQVASSQLALEQQAFTTQLAEKYKFSKGDEVDITTGVITREKPAAEVVPLPGPPQVDQSTPTA